MKNFIATVFAILLLISSNILAEEPIVRPLNWAQPVLSDDLDNCFKINDKLYRCGQPDKKAFKILKKMGVEEVLNLREYHSDKKKISGQKLHRLKWDTGEVSQQDLIDALRIIKSAEQPLVIHCWHGADRTGTVAAAYRIVFDGWSKQDALKEMTLGGFGYHTFYDNLIELIQKLDVAKVKAELGLD